MKEKLFRLSTEKSYVIDIEEYEITKETKAMIYTDSISLKQSELDILSETDERGILFSASDCKWEMYQKGYEPDRELFIRKIKEMYDYVADVAKKSEITCRNFVEHNEIKPLPVFEKGDTVWYGITINAPVDRTGKVFSIISKDYIGIRDSKSGAVSYHKPTEIFADYETALAYKEKLLREKVHEICSEIKTPQDLIAFIRRQKTESLPDFLVNEIIEIKSAEFGIGE